MLGNSMTYQLLTEERIGRYLDEAARDRLARAAAAAGRASRPTTRRAALVGLLMSTGALLRAALHARSQE